MAYEVLVGRCSGKEFFSLEDKAEEIARQLRSLTERMALTDRGGRKRAASLPLP